MPVRDFGKATAGAGSALAIAFLIYVLEGDGRRTFWSWPGFLAVGLIAAGGVAVLLSRRRQANAASTHAGRRKLKQTQSGGVGSTNLQAGRDVHYRSEQRND